VEPAGWPKLTLGWVISSPAAGDVDGDGLVEIVVGTREGDLFVWDTPGLATEAAIPWQGFGRDRRNTQNLASGVSPLAAPRAPLEALLWTLHAIERRVLELAAEHPRMQRSILIFVTPQVVRQVEVAHAWGVRLAPGALPLLFVALHQPWELHDELEPLRELLFVATETAATRALAELACDPGDRPCQRCRTRAERFMMRADEAPSRFQQMRWRSRALSKTLSCDAPPPPKA
jgi:hypothetical protein